MNESTKKLKYLKANNTPRLTAACAATMPFALLLPFPKRAMPMPLSHAVSDTPAMSQRKRTSHIA